MRNTVVLCLALVLATSVSAQTFNGITPPRNEEDANRSANIAATFSTAMQGGSLSTFRVFGRHTGRRGGTYSGAGTTTLTFDPTQDLKAGESAEISLTSGLLSTGSSPLTNPQVIRIRAATTPSGAEFRNYVQSLTGGGYTPAVRFGDMDGDGDLDAVTSSDTGQVAIYQNNGGLFGATPSNFGPTFEYTNIFELGDLDADGDLDVVLRNGANQLLVYFNTAGSLAAGAPFGAGSSCAPVVGDLDADGDLDLIEPSSSTQLQVHLNNGSGVFSNGVVLSLGTSSIFRLSLGDVDNDGDLDLLAGNSGPGVVFFNNGSGAFPTTGSFGGALTALGQLALFDSDADGDLDLVAGSNTDLHYFTGNATGTFTFSATILSTTGINAVQHGDLDGDGDVDLIVARTGPGTNGTLLNSGGSFSAYRVIDAVGFSTLMADLGDIDGDGDLDFACADGSGGLHICPNSWPAAPVAVSPLPYNNSAALGGNISATFAQNMAAATASGFVVRSPGAGHRARGNFSGSYLGGGTPTLSFDPSGNLRRNEELEVTLTRALMTSGSTPIPQPYTWRFRAAAGAGPASFNAMSIDGSNPVGQVNIAQAGDVDGDGDTDLICGSTVGAIFMINDGAGGFTWQTGVAGAGSITEMAADDFDLDGDLDLALYSTTPSSALRIYIKFAGSYVLTETISGSGSLACGDLNGDGAPDLVYTGTAYINNGFGSFTWSGASRVFHTTPGGGRPAIGDVDRDGDMDVVLNFASSSSVNSFIYLNDSTGRFPTRATYGSLAFAGAPQLADFSGDGWTDLLVANTSGGNAVVYNNTQGFFNSYFGSSQSIGGGGSGARLCIADFDGDADLDIVAAGNGASSVFINNGAGNFSNGGQFAVMSGTGSAVAALDLDNDGDLDVYIPRTGGSHRIHYNAAAGAPTITGFNPPTGSAASAQGSPVVIQFNRDMQQPVNRFYIPTYSSQHGSFSTVTYQTGSATITVNGSGALAGEEQQITVTTSVIDQTGTPLATPYVYTRRIGALGPGNISFGAPINFGAASDASTCALLLDYDRDGDRDVLIGRFGAANTLYRNDGGGTFTPVMTVGTGSDNTRALAAGDFNQDGFLDVVVCNQGQSMVYMGAASNPYTTSSTLGGASDDIRAVAIGDFNGAGNQQIAVARFGGQDAVFGWGSPACGQLTALGGATTSTLSVVTSDFNRDGRLDLIFGFDGSAKQVFLNSGSGFSGSTALGAATITRGMAAGDLTGDNYPDLVCANDGLDEVYLNNGAGGFNAPSTFGGTANSTSVALCELDGDGDLDVVVARSGAQGAAYRNTAGTLGSAINIGPSSATGSCVAIGDTDGDQELEVLLVQNGGQSALHANTFAYDQDAVLSNGPMTEPTTFTSLALSASYQDVLDFRLTDGGTADGLPLAISKVTLSVPSGLTSASAATFKLTGPGVAGVLANQASGVVFENLNISVPDGTVATYVVSMQLAQPSTMSEASIWQFALSVSSFTVANNGTHFATAGGSADNGSGMVFTVAATQLRCTTQPFPYEVREVPFDAVATYTDVYGNRDYDVTDTVTLSRSDAGAVLSTTAAAAVQGAASFTLASGRAVRLGNPNAAAVRLHFADDMAGVTASPCDSNAFDLIDPYTWTGTVSTDWNTSGNWSGGNVPAATSFIHIPSGTPNSPTISASATIGSVYVATGATLSLSGASTTLTVALALTVEGTFTAASPTTVALNGISVLAGGGSVALWHLSSGGGTIAAAATVRGNITGSGALFGTSPLITLAGTAAQTVSVNVGPSLRISNTAALVTFTSGITRSSTATLVIDAGASASFVNLTLGAGSFTNNGTLVLAGFLEPGTNAVGTVNVPAGATASVGSWVTSCGGTVTVPLTSTFVTDGNCDFSATTINQNGTLRFMSTSAATLTRTIMPPANNLGTVQCWTNVAANVLAINGSFSCTSIELGSGSGTTNISGSVTLTNSTSSAISGSGQASTALNIGQTLTINTATAMSISLGNAVLTGNRLLVSGTGALTVNGTVKLISAGTGSSSALEIASGSTLVLTSGSRVELGSSAAGTARILGTLRANLVNVTPATLAGTGTGSQAALMDVQSTGIIDLTGVNFDNFCASTSAYGIAFNGGCTITAFARIRITGAASTTAAIRLATANRPAIFDRFFISGTSPTNIDGTGLSGTQLLIRAVGPGGSLFGAAFEIDPAAKLDWEDAPYALSAAPAAHSLNSPTTTDSTVTFSETMQAPAAGDIVAFGQFAGKVPATLSGGGTATLRLDPTPTLRPGEKIHVVYRSTLKDSLGSNIGWPVVLDFSAAASSSSGVFTSSTLFGSVFSYTWSQALGDFDRDGDLDLATFCDFNGAGQESSSLFLNDGMGNFVYAGLLATQQARRGVAADINGDGALDLICDCQTAPGGMRVLYNNGSGGFATTVNFPAGASAYALVPADFDGDGDLDMLCQRNGTPGTQIIMWNNGAGDFSAAPLTLGTADYAGASAADFDGDYDIDIICGNRFFRNNGDGTFAAGVIWATMNNITGTNATGDIDGDGDADVVHFSGSTDIVYLNNGAGIFTAGQQVDGSNVNEWAELVDLDGDNDLDLLTAGNGFLLRYVNTAGTFSTGFSDYTVGPLTGCHGATLGDIDGDLDLDLVTGRSQGQNIALYNAGQTILPPALVALNPAANALNIAANANLTATFNKTLVSPQSGAIVARGSMSGKLAGVVSINGAIVTFDPSANFAAGEVIDLVIPPGLAPVSGPPTTRSYTWRVRAIAPHTGVVELNTFFNTVGTGTEDTRAVAVGDFDKDGDIDVALGNAVQQNQVWFNNGQGVFPTSTPFGGAMTDTRALEACDVDNDGDLDLLVGNFAQTNEICINNGSGVFTTVGMFGTGSDNTVSLDTGDANGDGNADVLVGNSLGQCVIYYGNGAGAFGSPENVGPAVFDAGGVAFGDFNNDRRLDVVLGALSGNSIAFLRNLGSGLLVQNQLLPSPITGIELADFDSDGDLDLIPASMTCPVQVNDGSGYFGTTSAGSAPAGVAIAVGDLNGDGSLDGVAVRNLQYTAKSMASMPPQAFNVNFGPASPAHDGRAVALADFDGDGDLDVVVGTAATFPSRIYFNQPAAPFTQATTPEEQRSNIAANSTVKVLCNTAMNPATAQSLPVYSNLRGLLPGVYTLSGTLREFTFTPSTPLLPGEQIYYSMTKQLKRPEGTPLQYAQAASFRVRPAVGTASFTTTSMSYGSGDNAAALVVGDFDADGDIDVIVANSGGQDDKFYKNNGSGTLTLFSVIHAGGDTRGACAGDFDADGDLDVVLIEFNGQSVILSNNGSGSFSSSNLGPASAPATCAACGDVDCDGDLDLAVGLFGQQNLIYYNNGSGQFPTSQGIGSMTSSTTSVCVFTDYWQDQPGIFFGNDGQANEAFIWNRGMLTYFTPTFGTGSDPTLALACGDFNSSFYASPIVANGSGQPNTYCVRSGSGIAAPVNVGTNGRDSYAACVGDFDGDGDLDVAIGNNGSGLGEVLINNGGNFSVGSALSAASNTRAIASADMDGDGDIDLICGGAGQSHVLLNGGIAPQIVSTAPANNTVNAAANTNCSVTFNGPMNAATGSSFRAFASQAALPGSLSGGGTATLMLDPTRLLRAGEQVQFTLTSANGLVSGGTLSRGMVVSFRARPTGGPAVFEINGLPVSSPSYPIGSIAAGDLDNDGDMDFIATRSTAGLPVVFINTGGVLSQAATVGTAPNAYSQAGMADMDNDGDLDVVLWATSGGNNLCECYSNTALSFALLASLGSTDELPVWGDLDGDADLDLCYTSGGSAHVRFNNGGGSFAAPQALTLAGTQITRVRIADVNNDYALDIVLKTNQVTSPSVFLNDGTGVFNPFLPAAYVGQGCDFIADFNGDGKLDVAHERFVRSDSFGTGGASFALPANEIIVGIFDAEGDGDLDLLASSSSPAVWRLYQQWRIQFRRRKHRRGQLVGKYSSNHCRL